MTAPTFQSFLTSSTGWLFAQRRIITQMIVAADVVPLKHFSSFHWFFSQSKWSIDKLGLTSFGLLAKFFPETIFLTVDDTLVRKRGLNMFGTGMYPDLLISSRKHHVTNWGHCWFAVPDRELKIVAVEAVKGGRGKETFYTTMVDAMPEQVLVWYAMRWSIEVTFHDTKQHLGFKDPQGLESGSASADSAAPVALLWLGDLLVCEIRIQTEDRRRVSLVQEKEARIVRRDIGCRKTAEFLQANFSVWSFRAGIRKYKSLVKTLLKLTS